MTDPLQDRVRSALGSSYDIEAEVGRGGMGVVYRCRDRKLRRLVAVKVLPPELAFREEVRTRFLREAETAAQLSHPNIVPIYAVDERDGLVWFAMAFVEGESLAARLVRERRPPLTDVRRILCEVADALAYAHAHRIIHRDIKPDNILLDRQTGRPLVTDFGIARAAEGEARLTVTGIAVGTPAYMSPEQATGERAVDGRSDQYSLSVVGYQMLAGELPFQASNTPAMLMKHISDPLRPLREVRPDVPVDLALVLERGLAKKPPDRWPDAAAFRDAVAATEHEPLRHSASSHDLRLSASWKRPGVTPPVAPAPAVPTPPHPSSPPPPPFGGEVVRFGRISRRNRESPASDSARNGPRKERWGTPSGRRNTPTGVTPEGRPPVPAWMPPSWHEARRDWHNREAERRRSPRRESDAGSIEERIRRFRNRTAQSAITVAMLATVNLWFSPEFLWFLFPATFMSFGILRRGASLWGDGVRMRDVFGREATDRLAASARGEPAGRLKAPLTAVELAAKLAPPDVLASAYGSAVRRAADDKAAAHAALARLSPADRELIPDVAPTVDALAERVGSIALALHRLDENVTPEELALLDQRITNARALPESPERDRNLQLLERRRSTLADLLARREALTAQLESAQLLLQNMRLDLVALGSAGVQAALNDVTSATQEARALSRDIQIALEAAREIR